MRDFKEILFSIVNHIIDPIRVEHVQIPDAANMCHYCAERFYSGEKISSKAMQREGIPSLIVSYPFCPSLICYWQRYANPGNRMKPSTPWCAPP